MGTQFNTIYNRFFEKITDDMYMELTPEDTRRDLHTMLISSLPNFEFPRKDLTDYQSSVETISLEGIQPDALILSSDEDTQTAVVDNSSFTAELTSEEINILAILMMGEWLQRQITSIENTRMKYSGADFKMTSQANHLQKLLTLQTECQRQSHHYQRLYKRRRPSTAEDLITKTTGSFASNWDVFKSVFDD